nr:hypothetical protein [uncultured Acetatifactor sp.]
MVIKAGGPKQGRLAVYRINHADSAEPGCWRGRILAMALTAVRQRVTKAGA